MITLGCDKNTVDSERLLASLVAAGCDFQSAADSADVIVINTCGFIDAAKEESVDTILEAVRMKRQGRARAVVAMGCLVQRYREELRAEIPEVDLFLGLTEIDRLVPELRARGILDSAADVPLMERPLRRYAGGSGHTSYLKISEGCDHGCAFCAIPLMRGKHRSTPVEALVAEAQELERRGVVELNIVSQDTTWYGRDWRGREKPALASSSPGAGPGGYWIGRMFPGMAGVAEEQLLESSGQPGRAAAAAAPRHARGHGKSRSHLPDLLRALLGETGIPWLRLFYMYPSGITPELIELMSAEPRLLPYLDMPIQHGSDRILARMRRPERRDTIRERVRWLREAIPDLALRTTVIVGFPGERDEDFEQLLELVEEIGFDHLGAFPYSIEEGTRAATMDEQVEEAVKRERLEKLQDVQRSIAAERNEARVGRVVDVLLDRRTQAGEAGSAVARSAAQALEVDGVVFLSGAEGVPSGTFVRAELTATVEQDMLGVVRAEAGE